jgi:hypothetical protein
MVVAAAALFGCVSGGNHAETSQPAGEVNQFSGQGVQAPGWTGLHYESVLPMGVAALLAVLFLVGTVAHACALYWSHRREMQRIRQNGHGRPACDMGGCGTEAPPRRGRGS